MKTQSMEDSESESELFDIQDLGDLIKIAQDYPRKYKKSLDIKKLWSIRAPLKKLHNLVGLDSLKKDILHQILFICQGLNNGEMMHTALMGPPGVGKTTVASILGEIYTKLGSLSKGTFRVVGREDLVAEYLGQTAIKTKKVLQGSLGGVLFIDEAYSLGSEQGDKDSYGKECIDTLTKFLSEHTKDFVCIIAGYETQLKKYFFDNNPGLDRRFPWKYDLEPYSCHELSNIFEYQLKAHKWKLKKPKYQQVLRGLIDENKGLFENNGGDTDNMITACKMAHSKRMFGKPQTWKRYLVPRDLKVGFEIFKKHKSKKDNFSIIAHMFM